MVHVFSYVALHVRCDVGVEVERHWDADVTEPFLCGPLPQQQRRQCGPEAGWMTTVMRRAKNNEMS